MNVDGPFYNKQPNLSDLESHDWPDPDNPGYCRGLKERAEAAHASGCAVVLNLPLGIIHQGQFVRGYGEWLTDLYRNPEYVSRMMEIMTDHWVRVVNNALDIVEDLVDIVFWGDDMGSQQATLFSPDIYRQLIKPRHARMFETLKVRDVKITYHSCGAVAALLDDLVEMGVDAVNPVQVNAKDMDPERLKQKYGDRLAFWGGIDTQRILPFGTPDQVRAEVRRIVGTLGQGGGYVLNSVHNIQPDVPPENVVAMFDEATAI
jgi:uroporphyrinogen decarboxylase